MNAPQPDCPSWCEKHTPAGSVSGIEVDVVHAAHRWAGPVSVSVMQVGSRAPYLMFDTAEVMLRDAASLAGTMRGLGHPGIAAAIEELLAIIQPPPPIDLPPLPAPGHSFTETDQSNG